MRRDKPCDTSETEGEGEDHAFCLFAVEVASSSQDRTELCGGEHDLGLIMACGSCTRRQSHCFAHQLQCTRLLEQYAGILFGVVALVCNVPYKHSQRVQVPEVRVAIRLGQGQRNFLCTLALMLNW